MQTFADKDGSNWSIDLSVGIMEEVKGKLGVDLLDPIDEDNKLVMNLAPMGAKNIMLFVNTLYLLCEDQCKENGITDKQFGRLLNPASLKGAYDAFFKEWEDFFLSLGREDIAEAMKRMMDLISEGMTEVVEEIKKISLKSIREQIEN